ncbi:unnamed protein product [Phaeothamnion confervicola]
MRIVFATSGHTRRGGRRGNAALMAYALGRAISMVTALEWAGSRLGHGGIGDESHSHSSGGGSSRAGADAEGRHGSGDDGNGGGGDGGRSAAASDGWGFCPSCGAAASGGTASVAAAAVAAAAGAHARGCELSCVLLDMREALKKSRAPLCVVPPTAADVGDEVASAESPAGDTASGGASSAGGGRGRGKGRGGVGGRARGSGSSGSGNRGGGGGGGGGGWSGDSRARAPSFDWEQLPAPAPKVTPLGKRPRKEEYERDAKIESFGGGGSSGGCGPGKSGGDAMEGNSSRVGSRRGGAGTASSGRLPESAVPRRPQQRPSTNPIAVTTALPAWWRSTVAQAAMPAADKQPVRAPLPLPVAATGPALDTGERAVTYVLHFPPKRLHQGETSGRCGGGGGSCGGRSSGGGGSGGVAGGSSGGGGGSGSSGSGVGGSSGGGGDGSSGGSGGSSGGGNGSSGGGDGDGIRQLGEAAAALDGATRVEAAVGAGGSKGEDGEGGNGGDGGKNDAEDDGGSDHGERSDFGDGGGSKSATAHRADGRIDAAAESAADGEAVPCVAFDAAGRAIGFYRDRHRPEERRYCLEYAAWPATPDTPLPPDAPAERAEAEAELRRRLNRPATHGVFAIRPTDAADGDREGGSGGGGSGSSSGGCGCGEGGGDRRGQNSRAGEAALAALRDEVLAHLRLTALAPSLPMWPVTP